MLWKCRGHLIGEQRCWADLLDDKDLQSMPCNPLTSTYFRLMPVHKAGQPQVHPAFSSLSLAMLYPNSLMRL